MRHLLVLVSWSLMGWSVFATPVLAKSPPSLESLETLVEQAVDLESDEPSFRKKRPQSELRRWDLDDLIVLLAERAAQLDTPEFNIFASYLYSEFRSRPVARPVIEKVLLQLDAADAPLPGEPPKGHPLVEFRDGVLDVVTAVFMVESGIQFGRTFATSRRAQVGLFRSFGRSMKAALFKPLGRMHLGQRGNRAYLLITAGVSLHYGTAQAGIAALKEKRIVPGQILFKAKEDSAKDFLELTWGIRTEMNDLYLLSEDESSSLFDRLSLEREYGDKLRKEIVFARSHIAALEKLADSMTETHPEFHSEIELGAVDLKRARFFIHELCDGRLQTATLDLENPICTNEEEVEEEGFAPLP